jgi:hypothetical protein
VDIARYNFSKAELNFEEMGIKKIWGLGIDLNY